MTILALTALTPGWFWLLMLALAIVTGGSLLVASHLLQRKERFSVLGMLLLMAVIDTAILLSAFPSLAETAWKIILGQ